jgi:hypothetical protein
MKLSSVTRYVCALSATALILASCGGSGESDNTTATPKTGALAGICPDTVVVQTDWFPEAEHGGIYELLGPDATSSKDTGATTGTLTFQGVDQGVQLQIRAGGPFLQTPVVTAMYQDDAITMGYVGTDVALTRYIDAPTIAVFNPLNVNPQVVLWNKANHPTAQGLADVAKSVESIFVYGDPAWARYFVAQGILKKDQVDSNYKGNLLLATEDAAHQGFATSEPYKYANLDTGAIDAGYTLIHDLGWNSYAQNMAIRADRLESLSPCLELLVPMMQQAQLDFIAAPDRTNAIIKAAVVAYDSWWTQTDGDLANCVAQLQALNIIGNGDTPLFGDLEESRVNDFLGKATPILREQGLEIADITATNIVNNDFLNPDISYQG